MNHTLSSLETNNNDDAFKEQALLKRVNWSLPALNPVQQAEDKAAALLAHLAGPSRPRFRFEYERKQDILSFLKQHYEAWRNFDTTEADTLVSLPIVEAQRPRALSAVAALGQAWWATGNPRYGQAFERFYRAVPTGEMFNWQHFNGSQGVVEMDAWFLLLDCDGFSREGRIAFLDHLCAITDNAWDQRTSQWTPLTLGPEGHNWSLHGIHSVPFLGILFPEFQRADFFIRTGISVIEEHLRGHYRSDGGARETSLSYESGSLTHLWDFYQLAQRNGVPLSSTYVERLQHATHSLLRLATPKGSLPCYGDADPHPGGLCLLASITAAITGDGECKWYAEHFRQQAGGTQLETPGELPLRTFWKTGLEGAQVYSRTQAKRPVGNSFLMDATGYGALRNRADETGTYLAVAAADRGRIVTSHGHNDIFSLEVHALGQRFLGDMGCASYGSSPGRVYDQKTEAHTCLGIDGIEQADLLDEWRWRSQVSPKIRRWISEETHDFFDAVHEGFNQTPEHKILHARKILFFKGEPSYFLVFDWLESNMPNPVSTYFHACCPGRIDGNGILLESAGARLSIQPPENSELKLEGVSNPGLSAYIQEKNLDPEKVPTFAFRKETQNDCLVWAIVPLSQGESAPQVRRLPITMNGVSAPAHRAVAVEVQFGSHTDHVMLSHTAFDSELSAGSQTAWGFLSFVRSKEDSKSHVTQCVTDGACGC